jgi:hypothetical protein
MAVKSNAEGISRYVGKYISKHVTQRRAEDKGARVVRFIGYKPGMRRACFHQSLAQHLHAPVSTKFLPRRRIPQLDGFIANLSDLPQRHVGFMHL